MTEEDVAMKSKNVEVVRGSGNVFRDLGHKNADADHAKKVWQTFGRLRLKLNQFNSVSVTSLAAQVDVYRLENDYGYTRCHLTALTR